MQVTSIWTESRDRKHQQHKAKWQSCSSQSWMLSAEGQEDGTDRACPTMRPGCTMRPYDNIVAHKRTRLHTWLPHLLLDPRRIAEFLPLRE